MIIQRILYITLGAGLLLQLACSPYERTELVGNWRGLSLTEAGDSVPVDPGLVRFTFTPDGGYTFRSTLNYREAGTFRLLDTLLLTVDTSRAAPDEKAVAISLLTPDSLVLHMQGDSAAVRVLVLGRVEE